MFVNEYKPEFYGRKVRKMRNLGNVYICGSPFVMSRTDAQNGLYRIFNFPMVFYASPSSKKGRKNPSGATVYHAAMQPNVPKFVNFIYLMPDHFIVKEKRLAN